MNGVAVDRVLAGTRQGRSLSLADHVDLHGQLPSIEAQALIEELGHAGLAGRGGAGFPTARKLALVASRPGSKVAIANGAETEPMSQKDRVLIGLAPHLVLDGLELATTAIGARTQVVAVSSDPPELATTLEAAVAERGGHARVVR